MRISASMGLFVCILFANHIFQWLIGTNFNFYAFSVLFGCVVYIYTLIEHPYFSIDGISAFFIIYIFYVLLFWTFIYSSEGAVYSKLIFPVGALVTYQIAQSKYFNQDVFLKTFLGFLLVQVAIILFQVFKGDFYTAGQLNYISNITDPIRRSYFLALGIPIAIKGVGFGSFAQWNGAGHLLLLGGPISYMYYLENKKRMYLVVATLISIGLLLTFSRGSLIALILGIYLTFFKKRKIYLAIAIIILTLLFIPEIIQLTESITEYANQTDTISVRTNRWSVVFDYIITYHPEAFLFGIGPLVLKEILFDKIGLTSAIHNGYLQLIYEFGIPIFLLFILSIASLFKQIKHIQMPLVKMLRLAVIMFGLTQLFDHTFFGFNGIVLVMLLGILKRELAIERM